MIRQRPGTWLILLLLPHTLCKREVGEGDDSLELSDEIDVTSKRKKAGKMETLHTDIDSVEVEKQYNFSSGTMGNDTFFTSVNTSSIASFIQTMLTSLMPKIEPSNASGYSMIEVAHKVVRRARMLDFGFKAAGLLMWILFFAACSWVVLLLFINWVECLLASMSHLRKQSFSLLVNRLRKDSNTDANGQWSRYFESKKPKESKSDGISSTDDAVIEEESASGEKSSSSGWRRDVHSGDDDYEDSSPGIESPSPDDSLMNAKFKDEKRDKNSSSSRYNDLGDEVPEVPVREKAVRESVVALGEAHLVTKCIAEGNCAAEGDGRHHYRHHHHHQQ